MARTRGRLTLSAPSASSSSGCGTMSAIEWGCSDIMASVRGLERIGSLVAHYYSAILQHLAPIQAAHHHDAGERISSARDQVVIDVPVFGGVGQFNGHILTLREESQGASGQQVKPI